VRDTILLGFSTVAGAFLAEAFFLLAVGEGLIPANYPCGTYLRPNNCVEINPGYQLIFIASGSVIGFLFYFVSVMHKTRFAFRVELGLALEGLLYAILWIIVPRYDPFFSDTVYFAEMFVASILVALAAFLGIDRLRLRDQPARQGLPVS
jgi:hypothetical protein